MGNISRRDLFRQFVPVISTAAIPPIAAMAAPSVVERAAVRPSEFLKMSPTLTRYYEQYELPLYLLEPRAKAAWRLSQKLQNDPQHAPHGRRDYDYWMRLAARNLSRTQVLKENLTKEYLAPGAMAEYKTIVAAIGEDVIAEYEWGMAQPPLLY